MASTDPVPDVPPVGTTTVITSPPLFGLFGGSAATTTISATPETSAAAVLAVTPPQPEQVAPTTAQTIIGETTKTFLWVFTVALTACALYLAAMNVGVVVPVWVLLLLAFVPFTGWISLLLLIATTVFSGRINVDVLRGRTLSEVFGIRAAPKPA